ncbi:MAG: hypothetical protein QM757_17230 [Paludibaculum sp.]
MRDLWGILGRFVAAGAAPTEIRELAQFGTVDSVDHVTVNNVGIPVAQEAIRKLYPGTIVSIFAAGEVIRLMTIQKALDVNFFDSGLDNRAAGIPEFYECLGLSLADHEFRASIRGGDFGQFGAVFGERELDTLGGYLNAKDEEGNLISDQLGVRFRDRGWGGGSCRIALKIYPEYVHEK